MLLKSRKDAAAAGENKFYTGRPCINGHYAYRYTASGTCSECINGVAKAKQAQSGNAELLQKYKLRDEILQSFVELRVPVHMFEVENFQQVILGLALVRSEVLTLHDVWLSPRPASGVLYRVKCHVSDAETVKAVAEEMYKPYRLMLVNADHTSRPYKRSPALSTAANCFTLP